MPPTRLLLLKSSTSDLHGAGVVVRSSGCLGNCSNAPNALLVAEHSERIFAKLCSLSAVAEVIEKATGRAPDLEDAQMVARLQRARRLRVRMEAREESKWNLALKGLAEDVAQAEPEGRLELVQEHAELLGAPSPPVEANKRAFHHAAPHASVPAETC